MVAENPRNSALCTSGWGEIAGGSPRSHPGDGQLEELSSAGRDPRAGHVDRTAASRFRSWNRWQKWTKAVALEQQPAEFVRLRGNHPLGREFALSE
jgi:hypothetical protein